MKAGEVYFINPNHFDALAGVKMGMRAEIVEAPQDSAIVLVKIQDWINPNDPLFGEGLRYVLTESLNPKSE